MRVKNIKIKNYLKLKYTFHYEMIFDMIEPKNFFNSKVCNFDLLTFDEVSTIKKILVTPDWEKIELLYEICYNEHNLKNAFVIDFFQSKKWIDSKIIEVIKREEKMLFSPPDPKLMAAGIENLNMFGNLNTKIDLAMQFSKEPREIGAWKYNDVLSIQARNNVMNQIKKNVK